MVFNSYVFTLLFLPISWSGYFLLNKIKLYRLAKSFLIIMSFLFYGYNNPAYLPIIIFSILFNYSLSRLLLSCKRISISRLLLSAGLVFNIGILVYFKYFDFFISNINSLFETDFNLINVMLPLGISFFTFQQLSYVIDSYKKAVPKYDILDYSLFVTFFPQLVAGPIVLHGEIVPQFSDVSNKKINFENLYKGLYAFSSGLAKKVLLADSLGNIVNHGFSDISNLGTINAIIVMLAYTFQIYLDFSGYCDMAFGIAYMFNIKLPINFNSPYKSLTITEFWKRWHITLSRFFSTYVYIPLGGNRKGFVRMLLNSFIVFFISGLWHGANWTFILWGMVHGIAISFTRIFDDKIRKLNAVLSWSVCFIFLNLTWVIFRAPSMTDLKQFYTQLFLFNFKPISPELIQGAIPIEIEVIIQELQALLAAIGLQNINNISSVYLILLFTFIMVVILQCENVVTKAKMLKPSYKTTLKTIVLLIWSIVSFAELSTFLYFNF